MSSTTRRVGVHYSGDLRQEMIDAAAAALVDVGPEHLSLREVARRVGVSHAAPANHFGDKAGMLTAVAVQGFTLFVQHLSAAADRMSANPFDALPANGRAYLEFASLHPGYFEIMFRPTLINTNDADYKRAADSGFQLLRDLVAACQRQGWRSEADTTALTVSIWALFHGLAQLRRQGSLTDHLPATSSEAIIDAARALTGLVTGPPPA